MLSSDEEDIVNLIQAIFSLFSVLGSIFMIFALLAFKDTKKPKTSYYLGLAFTKLVPYTMMFSTCMYMYRHDAEHPGLCEFQAAVMQLFLPTSWIYTLCISFHMWMRIRGVPEEKYKQLARMSHAVCWTIPLSILLVVLADEANSRSTNWCWLSNDNDARHVKILLYFFIPMAVVYILNLIIVAYAYYCARKDFFTDNELAGLITRTMRSKLKRQMDSLVTYPIIFLLCYTCALADRFYNFKNPGNPSFTLAVLHSIMLLDGFASSLVFGLTRSVSKRMKKRMRALFKCCLCYFHFPSRTKKRMSKIVQVGNAVLRGSARALQVNEIKTPWFKNLIDDMVQSMYKAPGVGLAAPQIGVPVRVIVLEDRDELISKSDPALAAQQERKVFPLKIIVNPTLEYIGEKKVSFVEGCLSVSGFRSEVERYHEVKVSGLNENGDPFSWRVSGWPARILQHEVDHINGMLYIDRMDTRKFTTFPVLEHTPFHPAYPPLNQ